MKKEYLLGSAVTLVVLSWAIFHGVTNLKAPGPADVTRLLGGSYTEHALYYDIAANYASSTPLLSRVGAQANTAAVTLMKQFVSDTITQFKTNGNFEHLTKNDIEMINGRKQDLQIAYLISSSEHTISYIFTIYEYTLGAHANTTFKTFTFNTTTGALLTLADIFTPSTHYLDTLSSISRAKLSDILGEMSDVDFLKEGTSPEDENFETFFFDNAYLTILFAPSQVASYAAGPQTLRIPTSELKDILRSEYQ